MTKTTEPKTVAAREDRVAAALRENLRKRKQQAHERQTEKKEER